MELRRDMTGALTFEQLILNGTTTDIDQSLLSLG
jgi:hypothetical protein